MGKKTTTIDTNNTRFFSKIVFLSSLYYLWKQWCS